MRGWRSHIPNLLSLSRLVLIVPFVVALARDSYFWLAITTAIIILSDYFDGFLARRLGAISDSGKILDPVADKICTAVAAVAMVEYRDFPLWLLVAMVVRDLLILLAGLFIVKARRFVPVSDLVGRLAMGMMSACFVIYLLDIGPLKAPSAYLTLAVLTLSLLSYARSHIRAIGRRPA